MFSLYGSWEPLAVCKILPWGLGTIPTLGKPILDKYAKEGSAYYSSARIWDDGIILPEETRKNLGKALAISHNEEYEDTQFGVFRM